jgi:hypothetical protein
VSRVLDLEDFSTAKGNTYKAYADISCEIMENPTAFFFKELQNLSIREETAEERKKKDPDKRKLLEKYKERILSGERDSSLKLALMRDTKCTLIHSEVLLKELKELMY